MPAVVRIAVPVSQIKREVLLESNIRIFNGGEPMELGFKVKDGSPSETKIPCWIVSKSALSIFSDLRYTPRSFTNNQIDLDNIGYWPCCLEYRDGSTAVAGKDPSVVYMVTDNTYGDYRKTAEQVKPYLDVIKRDIHIHYGNGYRCTANQSEESLSISFFGGLESDNYQEMHRDHIVNKTGPGGLALFGYTDIAASIMTSSNVYNDLSAVHILSPEGVIVAYVYNNDICIPFKVRDTASEAFRNDIYSKIIALALDTWHNKFNKIPTPEETKALFSEFLSERKNLLVGEYNRRLTEQTNQINSLTASLTEAINMRNTTLMDIAARDDASAKLEAGYTNEYDRLSKNPKLKSFKITNDQLVAYTKTIYFIGPDEKEREVGEMRISLGLSTGSISFSNMTRKVTGMQVGMHAPHVFPSGNPCLGNMSSVIPKLVTSYMLADAVDMSIAYLESVNERDGAGKHYKKWPLSDEQKKKDKAAKKAEKEAARTASEVAAAPAEEVNV